MDTELLLQILYIFLIIATIFLIAVLWRIFGVLSNFKETSDIILKRVKELDESISKAKSTLLGFLEGIKNFIYSLEFVKKFKNTIDNNKGE
jgi:hypothetical protein